MMMRVRFGKLTAILLATMALGLGAAEISADLTARMQVRRLIAGHDGLSVGSVVAEPFGRRVVLHDVRAGRGTTSVSIGTLSLPLARPSFGLISSAMASPFDDEPSESAPGPAEKAMPKPDALTPTAPAVPATPAPAPAPKAASIPNTATADNVTITHGQTVYRIKHIDLTGTSLSNADVASLLDQANPEPIEARLKKLSATAIVMPEVIAEDVTAGSERRAVFRQVALSGVVAGRITAGSIDGIAFTLKTGEDNTQGTTGAVQAVGIDLPQLVRIVRTVRTDDAEPIKPIYDSVIINAITLSNGKGGGFSMATLKETNLKARPFKTDISKAQKAGKDKLSDAEQAALYEDFTHSFEIGTLEMTGVAGNGTDAKGTQSGSLASFTMQDFANSKIGGMSLQGLGIAGPGVKVSLGKLETGPFTLPPPKGAQPNPASTMLPSSIKVDLTKLDIDVTPKEENAKRIAVKVGHAGLVSDGEAGEIPKSSKLTIDNVAFDVPTDNDKVQPLIEMGYTHLDLSSSMATSYDPATQALQLRDLTFSGVNMGSVGLGLQLINVTKGLVSPDKEVVKASMAAILVKGLSLDVVNEGLFDRLIAWKAKQDGMTVEQEKATAVDLFVNKLPATVNSANVKIIGDALAKFIEKPKNLHITILSKNGLGIGAMSMLNDPAMLIDTLDVKASANQ